MVNDFMQAMRWLGEGHSVSWGSPDNTAYMNLDACGIDLYIKPNYDNKDMGSRWLVDGDLELRFNEILGANDFYIYDDTNAKIEKYTQEKDMLESWIKKLSKEKSS